MKNSILTSIVLGIMLAMTPTLNAQLSVQIKLGVNGDDVNVYWQAEDQADVEQFILHRSTNGRNFDLVTIRDGNGDNMAIYTHDDLDLANGTYAYRLQILYKDGSEELLGYEIVSVNVLPTIINTGLFPDAIRFDPIN